MSRPHSPQPRSGFAATLDRFADASRRTGISRPLEGRVVGGVCAGVGRRYHIDPVLLRVAFVVAALFGGVGLTLYAAAVLVLPDTQGQLPLVRALRHREPKSITLLVIFGFLLLTPGFGDNNTDWGRTLITVMLIFGVGAYFLNRRSAPPRAGSEAPSTEAGPPQGSSADADAPAQQGGLVFNPETGGWSPSDTLRSDSGSASPRPSPYTAPPSGPAYGPPGQPAWNPEAAAAEVERQRAARRHRRLVSLTTLAFAVVVYTTAYLALAAAGSTLVSQLAFTITLGAVGLVLIGSGARRVRNRMAVWLAIIGLVSAPGVATSQSMITIDTSPFTEQRTVGDVTKRPTALNELQSEYRLGVGDLRLDLTGLPATQLAATQNHPVHVSHGVGDTTLVLPAGASVEIQPQTGIGDITLRDFTADSTQKYSRQQLADQGDRIVVGDGVTNLVITVESGVGDLTIERR